MAILRKTIWLVSLAIVLVGATQAAAQKYQPFGPLEYHHDLAPFSPFDGEPFGNDPKLHEGFFANYDRLYWVPSAPSVRGIGATGQTQTFNNAGGMAEVFSNSADTGYLRNLGGWGNRWELGYIDGNEGWLISVFAAHSRIEELDDNLTSVIFTDPGGPGGALLLAPVIFDTLTATQQSKLKNWELMKILRLKKLHNGSNVEVFYGVRYLELQDNFGVAAVGGDFGDSDWANEVRNNIIGPQAGVRWLQRRGDWRFDIEGRFSPAFNFQKATLSSDLAQDSAAGGGVINFSPTQTSQTITIEQFSPLVEFRAETNYQFTRNVAFRLGWTGIFIQRVGRANNMISYTLPGLGLQRHRENYFAHGVTMGIEINH
ncbi:MAG: BBP7 family outer membrane beta-barrel protein [Planctomycetes bacterium]|nr:BBP7 family outer membrane beta-barrel protein [Planctomycetota bacterium]